MKKHLLFSFLIVLLAFVLVGCGEKPEEGLKLTINNGKVTVNSEVEDIICEVSKNGTVINTLNIKNGDGLEDFNLGLGLFTVKIKIGNDGEWSNTVNYVKSKLNTPVNVEIKNDKIYFDEVVDADSYQAIFVANGEELTKDIEIEGLLTTLGLPENVYEVYVIALNEGNPNATSDRSEKVEYSTVLTDLATPTGLAIADGFLTFDVLPTTNNYVVKFVKGSTEYEYEVTSGKVDVTELVLPEGQYKASIKAKGDGITTRDSEYSETIDYTKRITVMQIQEKELIDGGYIKWMGRTYYNEEKKVNEVYHSASGFEIFVKGFNVYATITATNYSDLSCRPCIVIVIDDDFDNAQTIFLTKASQDVALMTNNKDILEHKIDVYKRSESIDSHIAVSLLKTDGIFIKKIEEKELKIEFIAASSSTGYGNLGSPSSEGKTTSNSDALKGFAFLTAQALNADVNIFSASGWGCAFSQWTNPNNTNVPAYYDYVDFKSSIEWDHNNFVPDVVVVNLGTNDWSYINAAVTATQRDERMTKFQQAYVEFLRKLHDYYPDAQIIVLYGLMQEQNIFEMTEVIVKNAQAYIPNLKVIKILGDAGGYNSHPSAKRHAEIAEELTAFIKTTLGIE